MILSFPQLCKVPPQRVDYLLLVRGERVALDECIIPFVDPCGDFLRIVQISRLDERSQQCAVENDVRNGKFGGGIACR